ncbi:MAG: GIY-YIG nuclease family protein [Chitinophagaceae bacterium]
MSFYVYIIKSESCDIYYKGFSEHPLLRLQQHNNAECNFTSGILPWKLVYLEIYLNKKEALKRDNTLKHYSHYQIENLIDSSKNKLDEFITSRNV